MRDEKVEYANYNSRNCEQQEGICVIPEPKKVKVTDEKFVIDRNTRIFVGREVASELSQIARTLQQKLLACIGANVPIVRGRLQPVDGVVILRVLGDRAAQEAFIAESGVDIREFGDEGYYLRVERNIIIAGSTPAGVFYGVQTTGCPRGTHWNYGRNNGRGVQQVSDGCRQDLSDRDHKAGSKQKIGKMTKVTTNGIERRHTRQSPLRSIE